MVAAPSIVRRHRNADRHGSTVGLISRALAPRPRNLEMQSVTTAADLDALLRRGTRSWAGINVSQDEALHVAAFFQGVRLIAQDIGKLPWPVYTRTADDDRKRAPDSPYWRLLHDAPNAWMDSHQFRELLTTHAILRGDGIALKNVAPNGDILELLPVKPDHVTIEQQPDFGLVYCVRMADGRIKDFAAHDVFHLRGFSLDGVKGVSVVTYARETLGSSRALQRHAGTFFGNGAHASGVYRHPGALSDRAFERLTEELDELKGEGAGGALILEEGMEWTQTMLSNEDSQFLDSRKFEVTEVARWLDLPPHKLMDLERATFTNIEQMSIDYVTGPLMTWGVRWDAAGNRQVIPARRQEYAEINFDALLRTTALERAQVNRIAVGRPWKTANEVRREENMSKSDDPSMDEVVLPLNLSQNEDPAVTGTKQLAGAVTK